MAATGCTPQAEGELRVATTAVGASVVVAAVATAVTPNHSH